MKIDRRDFLKVTGATAGAAVVGSNPLVARTARTKIAGLKVDYLDRPLGLENLHPRFSWRLESAQRNVRQLAYRILVASSEAALETGQADLWDSGKTSSRRSFGVTYQGQKLASRQRCWWCVQVWDEAGATPVSSETNWWEMGLLDSQDWAAQWLAAEDAVMRADREVGLNWVWGADVYDKSTRRFRFKFHLPIATCAAEFFAVGKELPQCISGMWIDGVPLTDSVLDNLSGKRFTLDPMNAGEHLIAVEVTTSSFGPFYKALRYINGLALFGRFEMQNGEILRVPSVSDCKTALAQDRAWHLPEYDDSSWDPAKSLPARDDQPWPPLPGMYLRKSFALHKPLRQARLYATALGAYEARMNGRRVGDALLTPETSQYEKRVLYRVYDVTAMLKEGENVLGLTVGDGWYASFDGNYSWGPPPRRVLAQLELTYDDGSHEVVRTGPGWRIAQSPIRESEIRSGEIYVARFEQPGWDSPSFDDRNWEQAREADAPSTRLVAQVVPPIRATQILKPRGISQPRPGVYIVDFGQNFSGWCRVKTRGAAETRIELKYAELLTPAGGIDQSSMGVTWGLKEPKRDIFILRGDGEEILEPHFTYRGFRYVEITGLVVPPSPESIDGVVFHTDLPTTGQLRSSVPLIEQLWRNTVWTQRSNFVAIPTDCPGREQHGWMADASIFWDAAAFNMDVDAFTWRQMDNVTDLQAADGAFPMAAPASRRNLIVVAADGSVPGWGDGAIILPWTAWQRYGDTAVIERYWDAMNRYLEFILNANPDYVWRNRRSVDFGDWLALDEDSFYNAKASPTTPKDLIGTAYWAHSAELLAQMGEAIGRVEDVRRLREVFERLRRAFNHAFVKSDGVVGNGSQTSYVLALKFNLLSVDAKQVAAEHLAANIRARGVSLATGVLGTQFLLDVLVDNGLTELAYSLLLRTQYPSWGYMIERGATTVWEDWSGEKAYRDNAKDSQNHFALAAVSGFLFRRMAGIDAATPGFETILIRPALDPRVRSGGGTYHSVMGLISTDWQQNDDGSLRLSARIPANTIARIHLPASPRSRIRESRRDVAHREDLHLVNRSDKEVVLEVSSGSYEFVVAD